MYHKQQNLTLDAPNICVGNVAMYILAANITYGQNEFPSVSVLGHTLI